MVWRALSKVVVDTCADCCAADRAAPTTEGVFEYVLKRAAMVDVLCSWRRLPRQAEVALKGLLSALKEPRLKGSIAFLRWSIRSCLAFFSNILGGSNLTPLDVCATRRQLCTARLWAYGVKVQCKYWAKSLARTIGRLWRE